MATCCCSSIAPASTTPRALSFANLYMYGGGFDMAAALLHKIMPFDLFETRRLLGAIVGIVGLALTWRIGRRIGGPLAGLVALMLLALCPTLLRPYVHEPEGRAVRGGDGVPDARPRSARRGISAPSPHTILIVGLGAGLSIGSRILGGLRAGLCADRLRSAADPGFPHRRRARGAASLRPCRLRADPRPACLAISSWG